MTPPAPEAEQAATASLEQSLAACLRGIQLAADDYPRRRRLLLAALRINAAMESLDVTLIKFARDVEQAEAEDRMLADLRANRLP